MGTKRAGVERLWRPFLGVVVAYAIAIQSLLTVLGGFAPAAQIDSAVIGLELCHQDAQAPVEVPAKNPDPGCAHCILCFAGAHHAVISTAPAVFHRVNVAIMVVSRLGETFDLRWRTRYTIASPRGPPLSV
jgi:hypothetical protein